MFGLLLLAGCSSPTSGPPPAPAPVTSRPSATASRPVASPLPSVDASRLEDLAALASAAQQAASAGAGDTTPVEGADLSWPQCPKGLGIPHKETKGLPGPLPSARFVIVGLTNGPGFFANPCLADQVAAARAAGDHVGAYAVASYPDAATLDTYADRGPFDGGTPLGALANVGYQQARFNAASMRAAGLRTPVVWIDVEPVPFYEWSADPEANAAVVRGVARGYTDAGYRIGVYSTTYLWQSVVGDLRLGVPEWRAAGQTSAEEALSRCEATSTIQGGAAVIVQWVDGLRDRNLSCPGAFDLDTWFGRP